MGSIESGLKNFGVHTKYNDPKIQLDTYQFDLKTADVILNDPTAEYYESQGVWSAAFTWKSGAMEDLRFMIAVASRDPVFPSADWVRILPDAFFNSRIGFAMGDGVTSLTPMNEQLTRLAQELGVGTRSDAIPGKLITGAPMGVFRYIPDNQKTASGYLHELDSLIGNKYSGHGIKGPYNSDSVISIPATVATAINFPMGENTISVATIGDGVTYMIDKLGGIQHICPVQNDSIDKLTRQWIWERIQQTGQTVTDIRNSDEFKQWISDTYKAKINKPGGVTFMNGQMHTGESPVTVTIPLSRAPYYVFGSDGLELGLNNDEIQELLNNICSTHDAFGLAKLISHRFDDQEAHYKNEPKSTGEVVEKKHDDIVIVLVQNKGAGLDEQGVFSPFIVRRSLR